MSRNTAKLPFEVRESSIQGKGAFAVRRIRKGQRIVEYTGERVTDDVAYERYDDTSMKRHHTFLFAVDDDLSIDGAVGGNDSRYINHSCDPNCEAWIEDGDRVIIYAKKDIANDEELTYDYAYVGVDANDPEVRSMYVCLCGTPKCRGSIVQPPAQKKKGKSKKAKAKAKPKRATSKPVLKLKSAAKPERKSATKAANKLNGKSAAKPAPKSKDDRARRMAS